MGWDYRKQYEINRMMGIPNHPPCTNCGKMDGGFMGSTEWGHGYRCCSNRCGMRLKKRIENGMFPPDKDNRHGWHDNSDKRLNRMRIRIKHLEKQLRRAGIKPKSYEVKLCVVK